MKQHIILIIAVVIGLLAAFLTRQFLASKNQEVSEEIQKIKGRYVEIEVVAVNKQLPGGSIIKREDLGKRTVFENQIRHDAVRAADWEDLVGRKTVHSLNRNEPVYWTDIEGGAPVATGLAQSIKPGCRAMSISVSGASAVSGMVRPNDRIDVIGTFSFPSSAHPGELELVTLTVVQDVTVLATGMETAKSSAGTHMQRPGSYSTVTLEVTPREAEMLVFAEQIKGRLTLALRNPSDIGYEKSLPRVNFEKIEAEIEELNLKRQRDLLHKRDVSQ